MRSVLSSLVFVVGFILAVLIGGYFMLKGGIYDAVEGFNSNPISWLTVAWAIFKAIVLAITTVIAIYVVAVVSVLIGESNSFPRNVLVKWQDQIDAKYLRQNRTKTKS